MNKEQLKTRKEYETVLAAFVRFLEAADNSAEAWETFEDIIFLRTSFLIERALDGLQMDFDEALSFLRNNNTALTDADLRKREVIVAAVDNLVEFAVAEEYNMLNEIMEMGEPSREECEMVCEKYNYTYAVAENEAVGAASAMALWWLGVGEESMVTYMTQGDERVRAWHLSNEGLSYPKNAFPPELIPPIEWGCRCFLISDDTSSLRASVTIRKADLKNVNPVFSESLSKGGRIFSNVHPYFRTKLPFKVFSIKQRIKKKLYL